MFKASHSVLIDRHPGEVFDWVADAGRQRDWNPLVRAMEPVADGVLGAGTRWRGTVARVGAVEVELVEYEPPRRAVHVARPWMAEVRHVWEVDETARGCRLVQHGEMRPKGRGWVLAPLMPLIARLQLRDCGRWLKQAMEP